MSKYNKIFLILLLVIFQKHFGQDIELVQQFNGRYDFTFIGNTMNPSENTNTTPTFLYTSSSSTLNLLPNDTVIAAYLYWAGIGTGDTNIKLNEIDITPDILYNINGTFNNKDYFSAFTDITSQVIATGNGIYELSEFDLNSLVSEYDDNATQFAGWAILVIYENPSLTLNQINVYQGMEALSPNPYVTPEILASKTIELNNLYLVSNTGAKVGFIAWEGDSFLAYKESLKFTANGVTNTLSNSLNPPTNAFNGTNTETNSAVLYNMDLDVYSIESYVIPGTTSAEVTLQSGQDYVMLNTIVTKLNSQLPDATITLENYFTSCNSGTITVDYSVFNVNSTEILPANTQIGFYIGTDLIGTSATQSAIPIGGNETGTITLTIPTGTPENFILTAIVDYDDSVFELNESNNTSNELDIMQLLLPHSFTFENLTSCNIGFQHGIFDFSSYAENSDYTISFYENQTDAETNSSPILNTFNYESTQSPHEIFVRVENELGCYSITSFLLFTQNCPPTIYNGISANDDGTNDTFFIDGLRDIFVNFKLEIYNRWGRHLWTGNNTTEDWNGYVKEGLIHHKSPTGTYFYILYLNDPNYPKSITGYLYLLN